MVYLLPECIQGTLCLNPWGSILQELIERFLYTLEPLGYCVGIKDEWKMQLAWSWVSKVWNPSEDTRDISRDEFCVMYHERFGQTSVNMESDSDWVESDHW